ncbi:MAG: GNAT family N-acetyltransferase [Anaerolineae bacterium]|nr:GNAT family N-acetyltransferase [Anaerolineae bacterium]
MNIKGKTVILRPATPDDRRAVFEWAALSDVTSAMMGPPTFPDNPAPSWEEFCEDHKAHFFDGSAPELGRCYIILVEGEPVGQVYYNDIEEREGVRRTEMDLWMRAQRYTGRGYGSDALLTLCEHLAQTMNVRQFMVQPSARNPRAIHAYEKIGFVRLPLSTAEASALWGPNDYADSVYMVKTIE